MVRFLSGLCNTVKAGFGWVLSQGQLELLDWPIVAAELGYWQGSSACSGFDLDRDDPDRNRSGPPDHDQGDLDLARWRTAMAEPKSCCNGAKADPSGPPAVAGSSCNGSKRLA